MTPIIPCDNHSVCMRATVSEHHQLCARDRGSVYIRRRQGHRIGDMRRLDATMKEHQSVQNTGPIFLRASSSKMIISSLRSISSPSSPKIRTIAAFPSAVMSYAWEYQCSGVKTWVLHAQRSHAHIRRRAVACDCKYSCLESVRNQIQVHPFGTGIRFNTRTGNPTQE